jgi:hypothetical protein
MNYRHNGNRQNKPHPRQMNNYQGGGGGMPQNMGGQNMGGMPQQPMNNNMMGMPPPQGGMPQQRMPQANMGMP